MCNSAYFSCHTTEIYTVLSVHPFIHSNIHLPALYTFVHIVSVGVCWSMFPTYMV